jgi:hypothetical protein
MRVFVVLIALFPRSPSSCPGPLFFGLAPLSFRLTPLSFGLTPLSSGLAPPSFDLALHSVYFQSHLFFDLASALADSMLHA